MCSWEAVITLLSFPVLVINSYIAEKNFFFKESSNEDELRNLSEMSVWQRKKLFEVQEISPEEALQYSKEIGNRKDITNEEKAKLMAAKIFKGQEKSRAFYRINGIRQLTGGRKNDITLPTHLEQVLNNVHIFFFFSELTVLLLCFIQK